MAGVWVRDEVVAEGEQQKVAPTIEAPDAKIGLKVFFEL